MRLSTKQFFWRSRFRWIREIPSTAERAGIAWRFLRGRSTEDDGYYLTRAGEDASGIYCWDAASVRDVIETLEERFGELTPDQKQRAANALERTVHKWDSAGEERGYVIDGAVDRWIDWTHQAGETLHDSWNEEVA